MSTVAKKNTLNKALAAQAKVAARDLLDRCADATRWQQTALLADQPAARPCATVWANDGNGPVTWEATTPHGAYAFLLLLDEVTLSLRSDDHALEERACDAGSFYLSRPGESVSVYCADRCRALYVSVPVQMFWTGDEPTRASFSIGPARDTLLLQLARTLLEMHGASGEHALSRQVLELLVDRLRHLRSSAAPVACVTRRTALPLWRLQRVDAYIEAHLSEHVTLNDMAAAAGLSPMHFAAQFRASTGYRPHHYLLLRRMEQAKRLMAELPRSVLDVALKTGFQTQAHFTTVFKRLTGKTPREWRGEALQARAV